MQEIRQPAEGNWIRLSRRLLGSPLFCAKRAQWLLVWLYLLLRANYRASRAIVGGREVEILPGRVLTSRKAIAAATGLAESLVERALRFLENGRQIEQQTFSTCRVITILNWERYQGSELQIEQQPDGERTADGQGTDTLEEDKEFKKGNKNNRLSADDMFASRTGAWLEPAATAAFETWMQHMREKDKPLTASSVRALLSKYALNTQRFVESVKHSVEKGWATLLHPDECKSVIQTVSAKPRRTPEEVHAHIQEKYGN